MAKFSGYYKIVTPTPETTKVTDSQSLGDQGAYGNYTWYQRLVQGSASRITRYREYDIMDNDVDISRALDIIAEEMTGNNPKTNMPIELEIMSEKETSIEDTTVLTLRAAQRYWTQLHGWDHRLFKAARVLIKYGDCFFKRKSISSKWEFIHPKNIVAAVVDEEDITRIIGWQVKTDIKKSRTSYGSPLTGVGDYSSEYLTSEEVVRFTLNDDLSESAPFGESLLKPVYRTFKQKELLEDSIIIYRIQRAPERRVFYVDVGKMPPQRVKAYLEQIKNEIRQKRIPTMAGGKAEIDSVYNPQSMSEDFFFAQRPDGRGSKVDTLPGGQGLGELTDLNYFMDKVMRGLRVPASYMAQGAEGAVFNDGKVGVAYIQELRFALFVMRIQDSIEQVLDYEFKRYMKHMNINVDESIYKILLPAPTNFGTYRQQELDTALLGQYGTADGVAYLSKRFILERYLRLTNEEIIRNERMLREEKGLDPDQQDDKDLPLLYNAEAAAAAGGGLGGGLAGGFGGGMGGMEGGGEIGAGGEMGAGGEPGAPGTPPGTPPAGGTPPGGAGTPPAGAKPGAPGI